jgi:hypothetical protein
LMSAPVFRSKQWPITSVFLSRIFFRASPSDAPNAPIPTTVIRSTATPLYGVQASTCIEVGFFIYDLLKELKLMKMIHDTTAIY